MFIIHVWCVFNGQIVVSVINGVVSGSGSGSAGSAGIGGLSRPHC